MECAHGSCSCQVTSGDGFCSEACATDMGDGPYCSCAHAECEFSPAITDPPLDLAL